MLLLLRKRAASSRLVWLHIHTTVQQCQAVLLVVEMKALAVLLQRWYQQQQRCNLAVATIVALKAVAVVPWTVAVAAASVASVVSLTVRAAAPASRAATSFVRAVFSAGRALRSLANRCNRFSACSKYSVAHTHRARDNRTTSRNTASVTSVLKLLAITKSLQLQEFAYHVPFSCSSE
jgi:ABC-type multidrug transport system fused ATPase/permease subunit